MVETRLRLPRSSSTGGVGSPETSDLSRRFSNVLRMGRVDEVDAKKGMYRVKMGDNTTKWIRDTTGRSGGDQTFHTREKGEMVLVGALEGDLKRAVIIGSLYQKDPGTPFGKEDESGTRYKDKAVSKYDRKTSTRTMFIPEAGKDIVTIGKPEPEQQQQQQSAQGGTTQGGGGSKWNGELTKEAKTTSPDPKASSREQSYDRHYFKKDKSSFEIKGDQVLISCGGASIKITDGKIVLTGDILLGGEGASKGISLKGTVDTGGFSDISNLATKVWGM